jgi:hypothetical protein
MSKKEFQIIFMYNSIINLKTQKIQKNSEKTKNIKKIPK